MFDPCQPIFINHLSGSLKVNTNDTSLCPNVRQWIFFYDYGYLLLLRLLNLTHFFSHSYVFKLHSIINAQQTLIYDSTNATSSNHLFQLDVKENNSGILLELIAIRRQQTPAVSFMIDYVFRAPAHSRHGRQILQDSSSSSLSSSFNTSQPSFIALICVIVFLVVAIIVTITILCYRHYSHRKHSRSRHQIRNKVRQVLNSAPSTDQRHLAASNTPSSGSSYSSRRPSTNPNLQQTSSLGQSVSTLPSSMIPSRRLQQSMMDAYLNDLNTLQPKIIDPKQLNSYLFIDLHSTSSETFAESSIKQYPNDNTTTSGYDTSTGGEDRHSKMSRRHRRRRYYHHQRQRRRTTIAFKRANGSRFLMRERSLPHTLARLPQLREQRHLLDLRNHNIHDSSTTSNTNQDLISTNFSMATEDSDENHAYRVNQSRPMNTIEEEHLPINHKSYPQQQVPSFFEMVSTYRGDDSDMPIYEEIPKPLKTVISKLGNGIAYVNDSIIV